MAAPQLGRGRKRISVPELAVTEGQDTSSPFAVVVIAERKEDPATLAPGQPNPAVVIDAWQRQRQLRSAIDRRAPKAS